MYLIFLARYKSKRHIEESDTYKERNDRTLNTS